MSTRGWRREAQGIFISVGLFIAWALSGYCRYLECLNVLGRRRENKAPPCAQPAAPPAPTRPTTRSSTRAQAKSNSEALLLANGSREQGDWPAISVVMPVKGVRPYAEDYWESQVTCAYRGPVEFIFVIDTAEDPANETLKALAARLESAGRAAGPIRVEVAGPCVSCSQKIFNQVAGFRAASTQSKYIVFLDNDILLHPGAFETLVQPLEQDAKAFMATGYPFDVPMEGATLVSYAVLSYHLPLMVPFSILEEGPFVWGGCMVFRADELRTDRVGLIAGWTDGGYSDDLLVTSRCGELKLRIKSPKSAIFAQLVGRYEFSGFFNYLYRQLYVLDTYHTRAGKHLNLLLAFVHCYLSSAYVAAYGLSIVVTTLAALQFLSTPSFLPTLSSILSVRFSPVVPFLPSARYDIAAVVAWAESSSRAMRSLVPPQLTAWVASLGRRTLLLSAVMWASTWLVSLGQRALVWGAVQLLDALHEEGDRRDFRAHVSFIKLWYGFIFMNGVLPPLVLAVLLFCNTVNWSGIRYSKNGGKVRRIP